MAVIIGGESKYLTDNRKLNKFFVFYCIFLFALLLILYWSFQIFIKFSPVPSLVFSFAVLLIFYALNWATDGFFFEFLGYDKGIKGEYLAKEELKKLPDDFKIYQDIKVPDGHGNIDFVIIGPTGIFIVEVKHKRGILAFKYNILFLDYKNDELDLIQAKREAKELHEYLQNNLNIQIGYINPILVFTRYVQVLFRLNKIDEAYIIGKTYLNKVITEKVSGQFKPEDRDKIEKALLSITSNIK